MKMNFLIITITIIVSLNNCVDQVHGYGQYMEYDQKPYYYQMPTQTEPAQYIYYYYHPQQAPKIYLSPGSYYDHRKGMLQPFPAGGTPIFVDYYKRCSQNFLGLKAHPVLPQYYYVCKADSVIFAKCHNLQIFNSTLNQCVLQPTPDYIPNCKMAGSYPIYSDCHIYYKCNEELKIKIFVCPSNMIFSPNDRICVMGKQCITTQITINETQITQKTSDDFPICLQIGTYRSPIDCSLYYKCDIQPNGIFLQIRYKCPKDMFYDTLKGKCLPKQKVLCDCIPVNWYNTQSLSMQLSRPEARPMPKVIPLPLTIQQSHFDGITIEDVSYPTETIIPITLSNRSGEMVSIKNIEAHDTTTPTSLKISIPSSVDNLASTTQKNDENDDDNNADDEEEVDEDDPVNFEEFITVLPKRKGFGTLLNSTSFAETEYIDEDNNSDDTSGDESIELSSLEIIPEKIIKLDKNDFSVFGTTEVTAIESLTITTAKNDIDDEDDYDNKDSESDDKDDYDKSLLIPTTEIINRIENITAIDNDSNNNTTFPRLEIIAEQPLDVRFKICPNTCTENHTHNFELSDNRAVFIKWFANSSNKTMALQAFN